MAIQSIGSSNNLERAYLAQMQSARVNAPAGKAASASAPKVQAPPPPPPSGGAKPAAASANSASEPAKIYDPKDLNQDGVVSYEEELAYSIQNPTGKTQNQPAVSASQMQSGLSAYQQNQPALSASPLPAATSANASGQPGLNGQTANNQSLRSLLASV